MVRAISGLLAALAIPLIPSAAREAPTLLRAKDAQPAPPSPPPPAAQPPAFTERQASSVWDAQLPGPIVVAPVLSHDNSTIYVGVESSLACLGVEDGKPLWSTPLGGEVVNVVVGNGTVVFVTAKNDAVYGLAIGTGEVVWTHLTSHPLVISAQAPVALTPDGARLVVATSDASLYMLDASSGSRVLDWQTKTDAPESNTWTIPPLPLSKGLYCADTNGTVYAVATDSGSRVWRTPAGGQQAMALPLLASSDGKVLYVPTRVDGWIRALSTASGALMWRVSLNSLGDWPMSEVGGRLYVPMDNGVIKSVDTHTGTISKSLDVSLHLKTPISLQGVTADLAGSKLYLVDGNAQQIIVVDMDAWAISQRLTGIAPEATNNNPQPGAAMPPPPPMPISAKVYAPSLVTEKGKPYLIVGRRIDGEGGSGRGVVSKILLAP